MAGAYRAVSSREDYEPGVFEVVIDLVWCEDATPQCATCLDYQSVLGPEDDDDVEACPDCMDKETPEWDAARDGRWTRTP